jgi:hypothetical protein
MEIITEREKRGDERWFRARFQIYIRPYIKTAQLYLQCNNYYFHKLDSEDREPQQEHQQQQEKQQQQQKQQKQAPQSQLQQQRQKRQTTQNPQQHHSHRKPISPQPQKTPTQPRKNFTVYTWRDLANEDDIEKVWQKTLACGLEKHRGSQEEEGICADYNNMPDKELGRSLRSSGYCVAPGTIEEEDSIGMANIIQKLQR